MIALKVHLIEIKLTMGLLLSSAEIVMNNGFTLIRASSASYYLRII